MDLGLVCLLGLGLHLHRMVEVVHSSLLVARGVADKIQVLFGTAQCLHHMCRGVNVARLQLAWMLGVDWAQNMVGYKVGLWLQRE